MTPIAIAVIAGAYLLGAIPFGLLVASRFAGVDVREKGSGNIGATNVARTAGKKLGIITLLLDALKGAAPVLIADRVLHQPLLIVALAGVAAVVGHVFPVYLKFKGGKGVATAAGMFLALAPLPTLVAAGVFLAVYLVAKVVSVGSLLGAIALVASIAYFDGRREVLYVSIGILLLIVLRHRGNIERLIKRTENKV
jgi:acyl phosphate:glycerol-3-phosphate acyltransferase